MNGYEGMCISKEKICEELQVKYKIIAQFFFFKKIVSIFP